MPAAQDKPGWSGPRAKEIREACGFIAFDVAKGLGTAPSNIMRWEADECVEPRATVLFLLAAFYGVAPEEFGKPVGSPIRKLRRKKSD
jgi:transcriptional regulator with XRE-family HTH domain